MWHVCATEVAPGKNTPQGVEEHYVFRIDAESNDRR